MVPHGHDGVAVEGEVGLTSPQKSDARNKMPEAEQHVHRLLVFLFVSHFTLLYSLGGFPWRRPLGGGGLRLGQRHDLPGPRRGDWSTVPSR